jgi:hypothetical protein
VVFIRYLQLLHALIDFTAKDHVPKSCLKQHHLSRSLDNNNAIHVMSFDPAILLATVCTSRALAHGIIDDFISDGVNNDGFPTDAIFRIQNGSPVPNVASRSTEAVDRDYFETNSVGNLDIIYPKNAKPGVLTATSPLEDCRLCVASLVSQRCLCVDLHCSVQW